jgi:hypothetical protein
MYTRPDYLTAIRELTEELGRVPEPEEIAEVNRAPPLNMFLSYFGTWNNAVREAGFTPKGDIMEPYSETQKRTVQ